MAIELPRDSKEFLSLLRSNGVEYLLIGGYAVGYHGYPWATGDMDVWIANSPENARRMVDTLREFGFDTPQLSPDLFLQDRSMVRMGNVPLRIEITTAISGVSFDECYAERVVGIMDGIEVSYQIPHRMVQPISPTIGVSCPPRPCQLRNRGMWSRGRLPRRPS
ncbi:MAG TPA: hypothetical protein VHG91_06985 [Longimicrobium sp.]|nr:hypothetical protein [Longimicrobium sp.]